MNDAAASILPGQHVAFGGGASLPCRRQHLTELATRLSRTIALARGLIQGGRHLDVTGIDDGVGVLCAQTLDLPPEDAGAMVPVLRGVLTQVNLLTTALQRPAGCPQPPW